MSAPIWPLPPLLMELTASGQWPSTEDEAQRQSLAPLVSLERLAAAVAGESGLYLHNPPFNTLAELAAHGESEQPEYNFWHEHGALADLDPDAAVVIGDFGLGSDAPIVLDHRAGRDTPRVLRLLWESEPNPDPEGSPLFIVRNRWVEMASTFAEFVRIIGLDVPQ